MLKRLDRIGDEPPEVGMFALWKDVNVFSWRLLPDSVAAHRGSVAGLRSDAIQYRLPEKLLLVSYDLPSPDVLSTVKPVKFVKGTGELKEAHVSERERKANFESVAYQVCLRTIHGLLNTVGSERIRVLAKVVPALD